MILTAIFDLKTNTFFNYFFVENIEDIKRIYEREFLTDSNAFFVKYPQDFDLYELGSIDNHSGIFEAKKELVNHFIELKEVAERYDRESNEKRNDRD